MSDEDKHMAICGPCQLEQVRRSWLCVPCDNFGYGLGCPNHAHTHDPDVQYADPGRFKPLPVGATDHSPTES